MLAAAAAGRGEGSGRDGHGDRCPFPRERAHVRVLSTRVPRALYALTERPKHSSLMTGYLLLTGYLRAELIPHVLCCVLSPMSPVLIFVRICPGTSLIVVAAIVVLLAWVHRILRQFYMLYRLNVAISTRSGASRAFRLVLPLIGRILGEVY